MDQEIKPADIHKDLPRLRLGGLQTVLYAYRIGPYGVYFVEADENAQSGKQLNFVTSGIILNAAGDTFRDEEISRLMAQNAIKNALPVSPSGLVAC